MLGVDVARDICILVWFGYSVSQYLLAWYHCSIQHYSIFLTLSVGSLQYLAKLQWWYLALLYHPHAKCGIAVVLGFAVALFSFALSSSCWAWYRCDIRLHSSGIHLCSIFLIPGMVSLQYSTSQ